MTVRSSLLLLLALSACGQTQHDEPRIDAVGGASVGGASVGGAYGGGAPAGAPSQAPPGAAGASELNCLHPRPGLQLPARTEDEPRVTFSLSRGFPIQVEPATWSDLAAAYDVNGDAISDLLYLDSSGSQPRFRLALTSPAPDPFSHVASDCSALQALPPGRLLLRDLNADSVPDFVVGTIDGVGAFLNLPAGLRQVLDYRFPPPTARVSLLDLGAADLNADGLVDLVAGFDKIDSEAAIEGLTLGAISFLQGADGAFVAGTSLIGSIALPKAGPLPVGADYLGQLAVGRFGASERESAVLVVENSGADGPFAVETAFDGSRRELSFPGMAPRIAALLGLPLANGHSYLLAVGGQAFTVLDLRGGGVDLVLSEPLAFEAGLSHELGGGPERPRYFLYDVDRDGDADFFERSPQTGQLALHVNSGNHAFDAPQLLDVRVGGGAEMPFIQVGPGSGVVASPTAPREQPVIYTLMPK